MLTKPMTPALSIFAHISAVRAAHPAAKSCYVGNGMWEIRDRALVLSRGPSPLQAWIRAERDVTSFELVAA